MCKSVFLQPQKDPENLEDLTLSTQWHAGSRIREKRLDLGLRQAAIAETVGISPSYLNLIEHNRRRIGGKLLADIARALDVPPATLTDGADRKTMSLLQDAAARAATTAEVDRIEELVARFPGWSALIAAQVEQVATLQEQLDALSNRLASDPQLAGSLHEVISAVTAIRSTASILVGPEALNDDWQSRFHENIHSDSERLAQSCQALITFLEVPETEKPDFRSPLESVESFYEAEGFHMQGLEDGSETVSDIVRRAGLEKKSAALLAARLRHYEADAEALPLIKFENAARSCGYDPAVLAQEFNVPILMVMRRLATLSADAGHPPIGLVTVGGSGTVTFQKPVAGFALARTGGNCPHWPVFNALTQPHRPIKERIVMQGAGQDRFLCYAIATFSDELAFDARSLLQSTMLVLPDVPPSDPDRSAPDQAITVCPSYTCRCDEGALA
ncbi:MAG: helix-turn-helix domain-containing protein [Pseudomonadota bacterium]